MSEFKELLQEQKVLEVSPQEEKKHDEDLDLLIDPTSRFEDDLKESLRQRFEEESERKRQRADSISSTIGIGELLNPRNLPLFTDTQNKSISDISEQVFEAGLPPFQKDDFTVDSLVNLIGSNALEGKIRDKESFTPILKEFIASGITHALNSNNPAVNLRRAVRTIGESLTSIDDHIDDLEDITDMSERILKDLVHVDVVDRLSLQPVDVSKIVDILFEGEMDNLKKQDLTVNDIQKIRREFEGHLAAVSRISKAQDIGTDIETYRGLEKWILDNVKNENLKQILKNDLNIYIQSLDKEQRLRIQTEVPRITPLSMYRNVKISREINSQITDNFLAKRINQIKHLDFEEKGSGDELTQQTVREFQRLIDSNNIQRDPILGTSPLDISTTFDDGSEKSTEFIVAELEDRLNSLRSGGVNYSYTPITIRDANTGKKTQQIALELSMLLAENNRIDRVMGEMKKTNMRLKKAPRHKRERFVNLIKETSLGNINIGQTNQKNNMRVIIIPQSASLEDIIRISHILTLEDGNISDVNRNNLLSVIKGITNETEILKILMNEQKKNSGRTFRIYFTPKNKLGGGFLDSSLKMIFSKPLIQNYIKKRGGSIDPRYHLLNAPISSFTHYPVRTTS